MFSLAAINNFILTNVYFILFIIFLIISLVIFGGVWAFFFELIGQRGNAFLMACLVFGCFAIKIAETLGIDWN